MSLANYFYNSLTKKYITLFGTIFNKISIVRNIGDDPIQRMIVPIAYGPHQKFLARLTQDPNLDKKAAIILPRMSFEITNMSYDAPRKLSSNKRLKGIEENQYQNFIYTGTPYNIDFNLVIMAKNVQDGVQIYEQILPFFRPDWTTTVKLMPNIDPFDIPLELTGMTSEDNYEGNFDERRTLIWTLSFTMRAWFFGPVRDKGLIKFIDISMYDKIDNNAEPFGEINIQPGLTANGEPTSNLDETIPYFEINIDDDWGIITVIKDYGEGDE